VSAAARLLDCGFEYRQGHGRVSPVSVVCCQVEVSAAGRSLVQRSPTECGPEAWPTKGCCAIGKKNLKVTSIVEAHTSVQRILIYLEA
jgi:hypothetical protein